MIYILPWRQNNYHTFHNTCICTVPYLTMGVGGLKSFVDNLRPSLGTDFELAGPLLIDGHSLTYYLFFTPQDNWILGGEYDAFRRDVSAFLATLCAVCQPHRPVILMDGVPPISKHSERMKRSAEKGARSLAATQAIARGSVASLDSLRVLPPWALPVRATFHTGTQ